MEYRLRLRVNGKQHTVWVEPLESLAVVLRDRLGFKGTKVGCERGECGVCTILLDGKAVKSCLFPALQAEDRDILTIEGLGGQDVADPVQEAFVRVGAVQCGFCTPGMVLAVKGLLAKNPNPSPAEIREGLAGNLCRCTGYQQVAEAIQLVAGQTGDGTTEGDGHG